MYVGGVGGMTRLQHIFQQPVARRHQLAHAGTGAFKGPVHREALFHQVADVMAQGNFVELVVLEAAFDKDGPCAVQQESQAGEIHVGAAKHMRHRKIIVVQHLGHDHAVEIGLVGPQQHGGIVANHLPHFFHRRLVVDNLLLVPQPQAEFVELGVEVQPEGAGARHHLCHIARRLRHQFMFGPA